MRKLNKENLAFIQGGLTALDLIDIIGNAINSSSGKNLKGIENATPGLITALESLDR